MRFHSKLTKSYNTKAFYYDQAAAEAEKLDRYLPDRAGLDKVRPMDILCEEPYKCLMIDENSSYFMTGAHFSHLGANRILDHVPALQEIHSVPKE